MSSLQYFILLFAMHTPRACHVYKTLHFKYKLTNWTLLIQYFENSTFGVFISWSCGISTTCRPTANKQLSELLSLPVKRTSALQIKLSNDCYISAKTYKKIFSPYICEGAV